MKEADEKSQWAAGDAYEPYIGRWSRLAAREFLAWLNVPPQMRWLDVGCGTGALSQTILEMTSPASVNGIDLSPNYVIYARRQTRDARVHFLVGNAQALACADGSFDAVVSGLALNFVPQPEKAISEMTRAARAGGTVAVYLWDYAGEMQLIRYFWDAAAQIDAAASELDEGGRFPICAPAPLERLFQNAGLKNVEARAIDVPTVFKNFDDYWNPFLGAQGPAPAYAMSLGKDQRKGLRDLLRSQLPANEDGTVNLTARAWAVRGER